jgi:hypothetical protein
MLKYIKSKFGCPVEGTQIEGDSIKKIPPLNVEMHANSIFIYIFTKPILKLAENEVVKYTSWECQRGGCCKFGNKRKGVIRDWRRMQNKELRSLYASSHIIRAKKSRSIFLVMWHVWYM